MPRLAAYRFRINQLSSDLLRFFSDDDQGCFGSPHLAYLTALVHQVTYSTLPCKRFSRFPWWGVTPTTTIGTPSP